MKPNPVCSAHEDDLDKKAAALSELQERRKMGLDELLGMLQNSNTPHSRDGRR